MRGWLLANLFLIGMSLCAAAILFFVIFIARALGISDDTERTIVGWTSVLAVLATFLIARAALRRIDSRR